MDISKFIGEKNNVLNDFYSETKSEILGYEDYLKLDTTEQYKNNKDRLKRIEKEKEMGWSIYEDLKIVQEKKYLVKDNG